MQSLFQQMRNVSRGQVNGQFIRRWPTAPKVAFFGPPNVFLDELAQRYVLLSSSMLHSLSSSLTLPRVLCLCRFAIDLGVPIVSVPQLMDNVAKKHGEDPDFDHPFFEKVAEMVREGD